MTTRTSLPYLMTSGGRTYFRRRGSKTIRLPDPSDPAFLSAYETARGVRRPEPTTTTVEALIDSYGASGRWDKLSPRTRKDYRKVLDYLRDKLGKRDVSIITRPLIIEAMEANRHRVRFANYIAQIASILCEHAVDKGWIRSNPVKGIRMLKPVKPAPHIPWPDAACALWRKEATPEAVLAFEIGVGAMPRPTDITRLRWCDYDGANLRLMSTKTTLDGIVPVTERLKVALDATPRRGIFILTRPDGRQMDYDTLARMMTRERKRLGCMAYDLHAMRYRGIMELAWAGCTDDEIGGYSLHKSSSMIRKYAGIARQIMNAKSAAAKRKARNND